ncbi:hypothetical protein JK358_15110 [Nocardia sp. 2]|uniref:Bacterial Ig-like domain-containing protein n=1 Tax=Nocardia acididurans TaxID=2802282 RepID=A0ABS1M4Z4_9NOCA|nr:Ig-like domain-containing protein [Nocardia acididurans]MBL1075723.1 hypothetical protein [Nocardia acididurans]
MRSTDTRIIARRAAGTATGLAALAAVAVLAAPSALAKVDSISVDGANHAVGKQYTITVKLSGAAAGLLVYFTDNGNFIGGPKVPWPPGSATISWTPSEKGQHVITAEQGGYTASTVVQVGDEPIGSGSSSSGSGFGPGGPLGSGSSGTTPGR